MPEIEVREAGGEGVDLIEMWSGVEKVIVIDAAKSGESGSFGDGKIFVSPVDEVYTVSSGIKETSEEEEARSPV